jgi:TRAP-type C4-dicarboxylate transport system substrate-binding protein
MKKVSLLFSVLIIFVLLFGTVFSCTGKTEPAKPSEPTSPSTPQKAIPIRLVIPSPAGDDLTTKDEKIAERFNKRAGGKYELKVYPGNSLAQVPEYLDAVRTGAVEMADIGWPIFAGIDPKLGLMELPFLFDTVEGFASITGGLTEMYDPLFQEKLNQKALGAFTTGGMELIGNKQIKTLADWKGKLVGAISPPLAVLAEKLGAGSQIIMWTDLYSALEKGVVDDGIMGLHGVIQLGITDVIDYVTKFYGTSGMNGYTINLDVWNKMPKDIQDALTEEIATTCKEQNELFIQYDTEDIKVLQDKGIEVYILPKAERDKWVPLVMPYTDEQLAAAGDFGAKIKQLAAEANKKYPYKD